MDLLLYYLYKRKENAGQKNDWKNWLIYILPVMLIVVDRFMFTALAQPDAMVSVVSVLKQFSNVVSVTFGGLLYKEPNLKNKLVYLAITIVGLVAVLICLSHKKKSCFQLFFLRFYFITSISIPSTPNFACCSFE